jgi:hypothetical protein
MATLSDLPVELFHQIIDDLPQSCLKEQTRKHDLKSLRLAYRKIEAKTRTRFGTEFFSSLSVTLAPARRFQIAHSISDDPVFGDRVTELDVFVNQHDALLDATTEHLNTMSYKAYGDFKSVFQRLVYRLPRLVDVTLNSPEVCRGATRPFRDSVVYLSAILLENALVTLSALDQTRLESLTIRAEYDFWSVCTPIQALRRIPQTSRAFADLKTL